MTADCAKCSRKFTFTPGRGRRRIYCDKCSSSARAKEAWANDPEHKEHKQELHRQWSQRNAAKISARVVQWQKDNPDLVAARAMRGRARKAGAAVCDFTAADWRALLIENDNSCFYCGESGVSLEREHKIPLARGGNHTKANIVPSCVPCNRQKGTMTDEEFIRAGGRRNDGQRRNGHHPLDRPAHGIAS